MDIKLFFGEEFCDGEWSVRKSLDIHPDHLHDVSYCKLGYGIYEYLCNGKDLTTMFPLEQIRFFVNNYNQEAHLVFVSLILLHNMNHASTNLGGKLEDYQIQLLNRFDHDLAMWIKKMTNSLLKSERNFLLILKGDHGFRYDSRNFDTYDMSFHKNKPFLHIVSNMKSNFIVENSNKLTSPFDIYDMLFDMINDKIGNNMFYQRSPVKTCRESGIKQRFCQCPSIV